MTLSLLNKVARAYAAHKPFFYTYIRPQEACLFFKHRHLLKPPVLDFGCDDGFFAQLAFNTPLAYGLDLPGTGINSRLAQQVYSRRLVYAGNHIPLSQNRVNTIVSNCVFEHISHLNFSLSEMHRILKPGGYLLTTVMTNVWDKNLIGRRFLGPIYANWLQRQQVHLNLLSLKEWQNRFKQAGFKVKKVEGYLSPPLAKKLELNHYLSLPQLLLHTLSGRWSLISPHLSLNQLTALSRDLYSSPSESGALFFLAQK